MDRQRGALRSACVSIAGSSARLPPHGLRELLTFPLPVLLFPGLLAQLGVLSCVADWLSWLHARITGSETRARWVMPPLMLHVGTIAATGVRRRSNAPRAQHRARPLISAARPFHAQGLAIMLPLTFGFPTNSTTVAASIAALDAVLAHCVAASVRSAGAIDAIEGDISTTLGVSKQDMLRKLAQAGGHDRRARSAPSAALRLLSRPSLLLWVLFCSPLEYAAVAGIATGHLGSLASWPGTLAEAVAGVEVRAGMRRLARDAS